MNGSGTYEKYVPLTGRKRTWTGFSQAWLGGDHLLIVHSTRFAERYRRFVLSDIQAIVVTEHGRRAVWQSALVLLCLFTGLTRTSVFARGFWGSLGAIALVLAIIDIALGPRCRCFLQTAVSRERLACVSRMRTARSFLAAIGPAIESIQGSISMEELAHVPLAELSTGRSSTPIGQPPAMERRFSYAPEVLFGVLMLDSVLMFVALRSTVGVAFSVLPILYFAEFLIGILALVQSRARNAGSLAVAVAAFVCVLIDPFVLTGTAVWPIVLSSFRGASSGILPWNLPIRVPSTTSLLATGWRAAIGVAGLLVCHLERTAERP